MRILTLRSRPANSGYKIDIKKREAVRHGIEATHRRLRPRLLLTVHNRGPIYGADEYRLNVPCPASETAVRTIRRGEHDQIKHPQLGGSE